MNGKKIARPMTIRRTSISTRFPFLRSGIAIVATLNYRLVYEISRDDASFKIGLRDRAENCH